MEKSNFIQLNFTSESTDEEFSIPLDNNSKNHVEGSNQKTVQVDNHSKYLDLDGKKNLSLQVVESEKSNESGYEEFSSFHPICLAVRTVGSEIDKMTSNISKTNNNCSTSDNKVMVNNHSKSESEEDNQQANKTEHRRSSVIFGLKRKPKLDERGMEDEELDDSGIALHNSDEIGSAEKSDSLIIEKLFATSKGDLSQNQSESDEGESDIGSKDENETADVQQVNKVERHYKVFTLKRKLISRGIENQESNDLEEKPNKRGRGRYMLRDIPSNSFSGYSNKKKTAKKRSNKLGKRNTSQNDNEDKTEDSDTDMVAEPTVSAKSDETQGMDDRQVQHNNMILKLLNEGSPENIKSLSRVGLKTANMIHQYRKLNGKLKSIRDLQNMPGWSMKFFELFLSANNIVLH